MREVRLGGFSGDVLLREEDLLGRPVAGSPLPDAPLESPQLSDVVSVRVMLQEVQEQRLRLERGRILESDGEARPILLERVLARPPRPRHQRLRRQAVELEPAPRRVAMHPGP